MILLLFCVLVFLLAFLVTLAALDKTVGLRPLYIGFLLKVFEWGSSQAGNIDEHDEAGQANLASSRDVDRPRSHSETNKIIVHDKSETIEQKWTNLESTPRKSTVNVVVDDCFDFITAGMESIIEDQVTSRFKAEQLSSWNLLTRTSYGFHHINRKLTILWITGFLFRYFILLPIRTILFGIGFIVLIVVTYLSERVSNPRLKKWLSERAQLMCMRILSRSFSAVIRFHDREHRAKHGGICVANHTSPIDVMILSCDNNYAMVGQRQGGLLGFLQTTLSRTGDHIWFERSEANDRAKVLQKLKEHVDDSKSPIIIFPEGTCINNTSVMMFKKGSFEVCEIVYPIAMKYDPRFGDAFWNSSEQSYSEYLFRMMTSWAIICDVWYLPPMRRLSNESAVQFALRVKKAIARKGGLVELEWDGGLKRAKVSPRLIEQHQKRYWDWLSRKSSLGIRNPMSNVKVTEGKTVELVTHLEDEENKVHEGKEAASNDNGDSCGSADIVAQGTPQDFTHDIRKAELISAHSRSDRSQKGGDTEMIRRNVVSQKNE